MTNSVLLLCGAAALFAFGIAFLFTPTVRRFAWRLGAVDVPRDARRMHRVPTARMGGLAIVLSVYLCCATFSVERTLLAPLAAGGSVLCVLGMADDIHPLSPWGKLCWQSVAALCAVLAGARLSQLTLGQWTLSLGRLGGFFAFLWILLLTNAMNLIDGLDGLCGGICAIASFALFLIAIDAQNSAVALPCAILCGACLGFLPYNRNPASIFAGDTGAMFLGYSLALLSVQGVFGAELGAAYGVAFLLFALPLCDSVFAILRRLWHGQSPFQADRAHLHHRLIDCGCTQRQAVRLLWLLCAMGAVLAVGLAEYRAAFLAVVAAALFWVAFCRGFFSFRRRGSENENKM